VARRQSLKRLKEEARDRRVRAVDPEALHTLQYAARTFRHWRTSLGTIGFTGELPPEVGIPIMNRLDAETDRLWKRARQHANEAAKGRSDHDTSRTMTKERRAAIAADAFVRLVETGGKGKSRSADLVMCAICRPTGEATSMRASPATSSVEAPSPSPSPANSAETPFSRPCFTTA
jgi:hypothetical protein